MRMVLASLISALLVVGCGGDSSVPANGNEPAGNAPTANTQPTEEKKPDTHEDQWLLIEARTAGDNVEFVVDGRALDLDRLLAEFKKYAKSKDAAVGLRGSQDGVSDNPIRFRAVATVSALSFWVVIEAMASTGLHLVRAELSTEEETLSLWTGLPLDQGLGGPKGPELVGTDLKIVPSDGRIEFLVRNDEGEREPLKEAGFAADMLAAPLPLTINKLRDALTAGVHGREKAAGVALDEIELIPADPMMPNRTEFVPWGAVWIAMSAIEQLAVQNKHKIATTYRFVAAMDAYKRD
ncbi:MAG: hypothetical protein H6839_17430 [Planctomycetes bacterium]|nr:hypothetical protein [Planctomycetota bacterium]